MNKEKKKMGSLLDNIVKGLFGEPMVFGDLPTSQKQTSHDSRIKGQINYELQRSSLPRNLKQRKD